MSIRLSVYVYMHYLKRCICLSQDPLTWEKINAAKAVPIKLEDQPIEDANSLKVQQWSDDLNDDISTSNRGKLLSNVFANEDLGDHVKDFQNGPMLPAEYLNYTLPWRKSDALPIPQLANFISNTDPEKFGHDSQGFKFCAGKLQRKGKSGVLGCHKIDLDELNHLDVLTLRKYLSDDSEILGRKLTGLCAKCQRQVSISICLTFIRPISHIDTIFFVDRSPKLLSVPDTSESCHTLETTKCKRFAPS